MFSIREKDKSCKLRVFVHAVETDLLKKNYLFLIFLEIFKSHFIDQEKAITFWRIQSSKV